MHEFNLRHATFKQALAYARMVAEMTKEEVSEVSGISMARISRYFQEHDVYTPSPTLIPVLCRAMGNTILVDWLNEQIKELREIPNIRTVQDLTTAVMKATVDTGTLSRKALEVVEDGHITKWEARDLQARFGIIADRHSQVAEALEALAGGKQ